MNATAVLDVHALTPAITPADVDQFAHLAHRAGGGVVAHPATILRLVRSITGPTHPAAGIGVLQRRTGVRFIADVNIPVGIVTIQALEVPSM